MSGSFKGYLENLIFIGILVAVLAYLGRERALDCGTGQRNKRRNARRSRSASANPGSRFDISSNTCPGSQSDIPSRTRTQSYTGGTSWCEASARHAMPRPRRSKT